MRNQLSLFAGGKKSKCEQKMIDETVVWQTVKKTINRFPNENEEVLPGVKWGNSGQLFTPAFWKLQYLVTNIPQDHNRHKLSNSILEEIVMCILGGYGIPSEMGIIAFERLRDNGLIRPKVNYERLLDALSKPFYTKEGKKLNYRFYNQKSRYIHKLLQRKDLDSIPDYDDLLLRDWLLEIDGIGLKTASWITRNWLKSDRVAILDVHLLRAGVLAGFFHNNINVSVEYLKLERRYLRFCYALEVSASDMDAIIWYIMKKSTKLARQTLYLKPENKKLCPDLEMEKEVVLEGEVESLL